MNTRILIYAFMIIAVMASPILAQDLNDNTSKKRPSFLLNVVDDNPANTSTHEITSPETDYVKVRLKDIARLDGVRKNQLFGIGLVTGLSGTGDDTNSVKFTAQAISNMLNNLGIAASPNEIRVKNFASVMVTADLPAFAKPGDLIDVTISAMGNAKSLEGGTLVMTPLQAANGEIYAVAQGPLTLGGFGAGGSTGSKVQKNFLTVGSIPSGAIVEREVQFTFSNRDILTWILRENDFTTATSAAREINKRFPASKATAVDPCTIRMRIPNDKWNNPIAFISDVEQIEVEVDMPSKVVINERNGTIVLGGNVKILPVSIAHGNITISVSESFGVSQPSPFSGGSTVIVPESGVVVTESKARFVPVTSEGLVSALNMMGATPTDVVAIFQAIKAVGALEAELEII